MILSLIVPCFNEEKNVAPLFEATLAAFARLPEEIDGWEMIFADDGSRDGTWREIQALSAAHPDPALSLWVLELDSRLLAGEVKERLSRWYEDSAEILFFPPSEKPNRTCRKIPLFELDRQKAYDHTCSVLVPGKDYLRRNRFSFADLERIVSRLRAPDGCPWDKIQTHASLTPYMVEEAWEAVSAIQDGDMDHLSDELGDVLFQVFIHTSIGESFEEFTMTDVLTHICRKMIQRHPHVFRAHGSETAEEIASGWEKIKRAETGSRTVGESLEDVSPSLPSLKYAVKVVKKLAQLPVLRRDPEAVASEVSALAGTLLERSGALSEENMSKLLIACAELCFRENLDAEILLHRGVDDLKRRYQRAEESIYRDGLSPEALSAGQLKAYLVKAEEDGRKGIGSDEAR